MTRVRVTEENGYRVFASVDEGTRSLAEEFRCLLRWGDIDVDAGPDLESGRCGEAGDYLQVPVEIEALLGAGGDAKERIVVGRVVETGVKAP